MLPTLHHVSTVVLLNGEELATGGCPHESHDSTSSLSQRSYILAQPGKHPSR